ncbi:MAG: lipopolysaccharide transport periplasmic protein LptA [Proteobacteria bacterium]|nr:lipopolysaccharide transport periplasmic protein LptA [Pseudomonadota bacterium]
MKHLLVKASPIRLLEIVLLLSLLPASSLVLAIDRDQPINIEADRATLNEKTGHNVYEGNVYLQQGTLVLQGSQMTVQLNNNSIDTLVLTGEPASYRQRPDGEESGQHAEAGRIEFYAKDDRIILLGNARAWRTGEKELRSDRIVFDLKSDTVNAGSNKTGDRVRTTLQPGSMQDSPPTPP